MRVLFFFSGFEFFFFPNDFVSVKPKCKYFERDANMQLDLFAFIDYVENTPTNSCIKF